MNIENEAVLTLAQEIIKTVKIIVDKLSFDKTKKGRIINHIDGKYYNVQLGGETYKALSPILTYNENDIVYVKIAENNYNNLIIECLAK